MSTSKDPWSRGAFLELSRPQPNGQSLYLYLCSPGAREAIPSLLRVSVPGIVDVFLWGPEDIEACVAEIIRAGLMEFDPLHGVAWLPDALGEGKLPNPNVLSSWAEFYRSLPDCDVKYRAGDQIIERAWEHGGSAHAVMLRSWFESKAVDRCWRKTPRVTSKFYDKLVATQGARCRYCGDSGVDLVADHVVPERRGGRTNLDNLVLACVPCNSSKGPRTAEEWEGSGVRARYLAAAGKEWFSLNEPHACGGAA